MTLAHNSCKTIVILVWELQTHLMSTTSDVIMFFEKRYNAERTFSSQVGQTLVSPNAARIIMILHVIEDDMQCFPR